MRKGKALLKHTLRRQFLRKHLRNQQLRRHQQWHMLCSYQLPLPLIAPPWPDSPSAEPQQSVPGH